MSNNGAPVGGTAAFRRLWASTAANNLADGIVHLIVPVSAVGLGAGSTQVALVVAAQLAPWLLLSPVSGLVADRFNAKLIIRSAAALRAVAGAGLLVALDSVDAPIALMALAAAVLGTAEVAADIAALSAVPDVVPDTDLEWAYGRIQSTQIAGDTLLGPALGGLLISLSGAAAVLPAIGLFVLGGIVVPTIGPRHDINEPQPIAAQPIDGWRATWDDRWIRRALLAAAAMNAGSGVSATALVAYAVEPGPLGLSESHYGALIGTAGLGAIIGAPLVSKLSQVLTPNQLIRLGAIGVVAVISAPAITRQPSALAALLLTGSVLGPSFAVTVISTRQRRVVPTMRGRVNALFQTIGTGTGTGGALAAGVMIDRIGFRSTFVAASLFVTGLTLVARPWSFDASAQ